MFILNTIFDKTKITERVKELYDGLLNSEFEAKALELFDKFLQYFAMEIKNNLCKNTFLIGGPDAMRSGIHHMLSLVSDFLLEAHVRLLPDRNVYFKGGELDVCHIM